MRRAALVVLLLAVGCGGDDDRPARLSYIAPAILEPNCATAGCHSKLTATYGIQLETYADCYTYLVGTGAGDLVVPFRPDDSKLLFMLRGEGVWQRMPPDSPLPDADIDLIERWILEGAQRN